MKRWAMLLAVVLIPYLCSGFYIVKGNESAVIRRFGKLQRTEAGTVALKSSDWYYDLPWPFAKVDRVNLNEVRTLSIGSPQVDDIEADRFLQAVGPALQSQFLTGDKNILNIQISVHYRISEGHVAEYLFGSESSERRLQLLAEATLANALLRCGVDFVHTLGRSELRQMLIQRTRELARLHNLGLEVDDVTIGSVYPPIRVKAQFLDVMNARADRETYINNAKAFAEQRLADATAQKKKIVDEAEIYKQRIVEAARGESESFVKLIDRFEIDERQGIQSRQQARQMALRRRYIETMEEILRKVAGKVFLDSGKPVDLTIIRDPTE